MTALSASMHNTPPESSVPISADAVISPPDETGYVEHSTSDIPPMT